MSEERNCLKCNNVFQSRGAGNRLCARCNADNANLSHRQQSYGHVSLDIEQSRGVRSELEHLTSEHVETAQPKDAAKSRKKTRAKNSDLHNRSG